MALVTAGDTFVEATTDTNLTAHTPTGPDAGTGWGTFVGSAQVLATPDLAEDTNIAAGNRLNMNDDLGSSSMDVTADLSFNGAVAGDGIWGGPAGRASSSTTQGGYEAGYNLLTGGWFIDALTTSTLLVESYPGGTVTCRLEIRQAAKKLYVNGVLKCTVTNDDNPTAQYAGILLGNFGGNAAKRIRVDNFLAVGVASRPNMLPLLGVGMLRTLGLLQLTQPQNRRGFFKSLVACLVGPRR